MQVRDLAKCQLEELRWNVFCEQGNDYNSVEEISDEDLFQRYEDVEFSNDDFRSTMGWTSVAKLVWNNENWFHSEKESEEFNPDETSPKEKLMEMLNGEWHLFGMDGDTITVVIKD